MLSNNAWFSAMCSSASATRWIGASTMPTERHHGPPGGSRAHDTTTGLSAICSNVTSGPGRAWATDNNDIHMRVPLSRPDPDPQPPADHPHPQPVVETRTQQHGLDGE